MRSGLSPAIQKRMGPHRLLQGPFNRAPRRSRDSTAGGLTRSGTEGELACVQGPASLDVAHLIHDPPLI